MSILYYNSDLRETKIYEAYGYTVYVKINKYQSSIDGFTNDCYTSIKIINSEGNEIINCSFSNQAIDKNVFTKTIDLFLFWISTNKPSQQEIINQIHKSLLAYNGLFITRMSSTKYKKRQENASFKKINFKF